MRIDAKSGAQVHEEGAPEKTQPASGAKSESASNRGACGAADSLEVWRPSGGACTNQRPSRAERRRTFRA